MEKRCGYIITYSEIYQFHNWKTLSLKSVYRARVAQWANNSYKHITNTVGVRARLCKLQKGCTRFAAASDKVYQLLAHGRWFSPGTPTSSTTTTGRHDIAEILLKVALSTKNQINQIKSAYLGKHIQTENLTGFRANVTWLMPNVEHGAACLSGAKDFTPGFCGVRVAEALVLCVVFVSLSRSLYFSFWSAIVLSTILLFTATDYAFGIFRSIFWNNTIIYKKNNEENYISKLSSSIYGTYWLRL